MNWLKRKWDEDPAEVVKFSLFVLQGVLLYRYAHKFATLKSTLAENAMRAYMEGYDEGSLAGYDHAMEGHNRPIINK